MQPINSQHFVTFILGIQSATKHFFISLSRTMTAPRTIHNYLWDTIKYVTNALMPNYLHRTTSHTAAHEDKLPRASFLDGLRGYASLVVFISHFLDPFQPGKRFGYGYDQENSWLLQLPIIRLLYSGVPMVALFFIISGYALSLKPFLLIRSGSWGQFSDTIASAIFRRGLRLFLPTLVSTFLVMISTRLRVQDFAGYSTLPGLIEERPRRFISHYDQLSDWCHFVIAELTNPWAWQVHNYVYDSHLWTIPIEFRASIILFLFITCISRFRPHLRLVLSCGLWAYCMWCNKWHVALFICGMCFADVPIEIGLSLQRTNPKKSLFFRLPLLTLGLFLLSFPIRNSSKTPGYIWLSIVTPKYTNWHTIGAILAFWTLTKSKEIQKIFTTSFSAYLGKISYAMYLVHGPVLHSFGYGTVSCIWSVFGKETTIQYQGGIILGFLLVTPVVFWWSDVFERLVDRPSVELARWLYLKGRISE